MDRVCVPDAVMNIQAAVDKHMGWDWKGGWGAEVEDLFIFCRLPTQGNLVSLL